MRKALVLMVMAVLVLLGACGESAARPAQSILSKQTSEEHSSEPSSSFQDMGAPAPAATALPPRGMVVQGEAFREAGGESGAGGESSLETAERKVISTASLAIEVEVVQTATAEVRAIAETLGGFVEQLTSSGGPERQRAAMTVRIPHDQFSRAMERIEVLGKVQNRNEGSEDVSERFIDLNARLQSSLREEQSLLALLGKTATVSEVLSIERELARVRSEVERFQGQLNFLERRVDLATINVTLFPPEEPVPEPPSASLTIEVLDVTANVNTVKSLVESVEGAVDQVILSVSDDREGADVSFRVFPADFQQVMKSLEGQGKVLDKEVREGASSAKKDTSREGKPNARIALSFVEEPGGVGAGVVLAIVALLAAVILLAAGIATLSYRAGRRRRGR